MSDPFHSTDQTCVIAGAPLHMTYEEKQQCPNCRADALADHNEQESNKGTDIPPSRCAVSFAAPGFTDHGMEFVNVTPEQIILAGNLLIRLGEQQMTIREQREAMLRGPQLVVPT